MILPNCQEKIIIRWTVLKPPQVILFYCEVGKFSDRSRLRGRLRWHWTTPPRTCTQSYAMTVKSNYTHHRAHDLGEPKAIDHEVFGDRPRWSEGTRLRTHAQTSKMEPNHMVGIFLRNRSRVTRNYWITIVKRRVRENAKLFSRAWHASRS